MAKRNLVYVRAGDNSLHSSWAVSREERNYDLFVSYFGSRPGTFQNDGEYYEAVVGLKFPAVTRLLKERPELFDSYDAIWIPDDDLLTSAEHISRMFELFHKYKLQLAQPALALGSYMAHPVTAAIKRKSLHFTRYVEVMCPVFSRFALKKLAPTFSLNVSSWGIDFLWGHQLGYPAKRIAVIDETPVVHTRPIGKGSFYDALKGAKVNPEAESLKIMRKYKLSDDWEMLRRRVFGSVSMKSRRTVAGDWVSLHFLQVMIDQNCKSPIFYENRSKKLRLKKHERPDFAAIVDDHLNGTSGQTNGHSHTSNLKKMHSDLRMEAIAKDFIKHWTARQRMLNSKAMIVCSDAGACRKLFRILGKLRPQWKRDGLFDISVNGRGKTSLGAERRVRLAERFKNAHDPLKAVIVDSIEAEDFYSPLLNTLYTDVPKPVEQHHNSVGQLMRMFQSRLATLVVDYVGLSDVAFQANEAPALKSSMPQAPNKASRNVFSFKAGNDIRNRSILAPVTPEKIPDTYREKASSGALKKGERIAHLFLIRKNLNHERIWRKFFEGYEDYYNVYVHAKEPDQMRSRVLRGKHISQRCETTYGHVSLVKAEIMLLEEALKEKTNKFFLLHSESCVPIRSFEYVYRQLFGTGRSWLYSFKGDMWRYYGIKPAKVRHKCFFKSSQFFCLTRSHAEQVLANGRIEDWENCSCADEHYVPTVLAMEGKLHECLPQPLTFAEWNRQRREGGWGPATYHELLPSDVKALSRTDSLFARKFAPDSDIENYLEELHSRSLANVPSDRNN